MNLLRNSIKSYVPIRFRQQNPHPSFLLRGSSQHFSSEAESPTTQETTQDPFPQTPNTGLVYGKLFGVTKHTTKTDIINLLEGCNLSADDIKVGYNRAFNPSGMLIQFSSRRAFDAAIRAINRRDRLYRLDVVDRSQWDLLLPYDGKAILLRGIPKTAQLDDIERFLSGCAYDSSTMQVTFRKTDPESEPSKIAVVHFPSRTQAMHAFLTKNRSFCQNDQVSVRVLH